MKPLSTEPDTFLQPKSLVEYIPGPGAVRKSKRRPVSQEKLRRRKLRLLKKKYGSIFYVRLGYKPDLDSRFDRNRLRQIERAELKELRVSELNTKSEER